MRMLSLTRPRRPLRTRLAFTDALPVPICHDLQVGPTSGPSNASKNLPHVGDSAAAYNNIATSVFNGTGYANNGFGALSSQVRIAR